MHVPDSSLCSIHPDGRLEAGICRSVTNTWVIAFSLPNCKSEFTSPLCLIVDLTCQMRRGLWITCQNNSTNKRQTPGLLDVELQTLLLSSIQMEQICKACAVAALGGGDFCCPPAPGGVGLTEIKCLSIPGCSFSLGEMGARILQTGWQYLAFIGFLIKVPNCLMWQTPVLETLNLTLPPVALLDSREHPF